MSWEERWEGSAVRRGVDWLFFSPWSPLGSLASIEALLGAAGHLPLLSLALITAAVQQCCLIAASHRARETTAARAASTWESCALSRFSTSSLCLSLQPGGYFSWKLSALSVSPPHPKSHHSAGHARAWFLFPFSLENQDLTVALKKGCLFFSKWFWN